MYKFDLALSSSSAFKERFVWLLYLGIVFFLLYGSVNELSNSREIDFSFFMDWEKNIPFIEIFIIPYMSSDVLFVIAFLLSQTRLQLRILSLRIFLNVFISIIFFVLVPLKFAFEKPLVDNFLFEMLKMDLPYNQMPSLHVSLAVILWFSMKETIKNKFLKVFLFVWLVLIVLSTLFVYQHHFIDIPSGFILALVIVYFVNEKRCKALLEAFTTPRSLKIALYYLVLSIVFMILTFSFSSYIMFYLFCSVFSLSVIYAFGLKFLLVNEKAKANIFQIILFAPYFIGSHLSWIYYKKRIPFLSKYDENIYFGRQASKDEYKKLEELGITKIINLSSELQFFTSPINENRYNFLDLTIQNPQELLSLVKEIKNSDEKIYIHCKLGMSRTILVISSLLLYEKKDLDYINTFLEETRPIYLKSKYMHINLNFFKILINK